MRTSSRRHTARFTAGGVALVIAAAAYACGDADDREQSVVADGGATVDGRVTPRDPDAAPLVDPKRPDSYDAASIARSLVLINEVSATDEFVELVNSTDAGIEITGYVLADRDKTTGGPKVAEALTFPATTVVGPGSYVLIESGGADAKSCPDAGESFCFRAEFGISNKDGETLFLLFPDGGVAGQVTHPPNASSDTTSYARFPNADPSGAFASARPSPGTANTRDAAP